MMKKKFCEGDIVAIISETNLWWNHYSAKAPPSPSTSRILNAADVCFLVKVEKVETFVISRLGTGWVSNRSFRVID